MKIPFNQDQLNLLNTIGFDFDVSDELNDDQIDTVIEVVSNYLQLYGLSNKGLNAAGQDCRNLLDMLGDY